MVAERFGFGPIVDNGKRADLGAAHRADDDVQFYRYSTVSILDDYDKGVVKTIDGCAEMEQLTHVDNMTLPNKYDSSLQTCHVAAR